MKSLHDKIAQIYYTYGLFCASHPFATIVTVILLGFITCWPLSNLPLPGNTPLQYRTPIAGLEPRGIEPSNNSHDDLKHPRWHHGQPLVYIQQIVMKSAVSPWHPNQMVTLDAFRAPLASVFPLLEQINNFKYSDKTGTHSVEDICFRVSEPVNAKHLQGHFPDYSCLILSPGIFWGNSVERFAKDSSVLETVYKRYGQNVESPPAARDLLFGVPWTLTGISKYYIRNRQRVISYAVTLVLKKHNKTFISALRSKLESTFPATNKNVNNSQVADLVHVHFKDSNYFVEYTPLLVTYLVLLMYLYFSVCKIDFVKSKIGLAFSAVFTVFSSLLMSCSICTFFGLAPTLNGGEIFPYLVVIIGVENVLVITKSVVSTPVHLDVKYRVAQGLMKEGWSITKNLVTELFIVFIGFMTFVPAIQEFSTFALVGILSDFLLQMVFFAPVLSVDIRRMELSDLHRQSVKQAVQEYSFFNVANIEPLMLCPFAPDRNRRSKKISSLSPSSSSSIHTESMAQRGHQRNSSLSKLERPKYEMPRRVKFFYFLARFRIIQKLIMVCTVVWIGLILHKVGLVAKLTGDDTDDVILSKPQNYTVLNVTPDSIGSEDEKLQAPSSSRTSHVHPGPVEHVDLETWNKLSYKHWPSLFHYYNVSLFGRYITMLPTIHLSQVVDPKVAIKMRHPSDTYSHVWQPIKTEDHVTEETDSHETDDGVIFHHYQNLQNLNNFYPKSQKEYAITICLCFLSVIVITYFMVTLYKCMCSRNYSRWRHSWSKYNRRSRSKGYYKQIKESVPLLLAGHDQSIECLWSDNGLIISCCLGGQLKIWDSNTGDCINTIKRKSMTPPTTRKPCIGRNIEDSDADLYAEYHGGVGNLSRSSSDESLLGGDGVRSRKGRGERTVSGSSSVFPLGDKYDDIKSDFSSCINTEFTTKDPNAHITSSDGYDFSRWLEADLCDEPKTSEENENSGESRNHSYNDLTMLSSHHRSQSWSNGDLLLAEEDSLYEPSMSVWCLASLHGLIITGCGNGRIEVWEAETGDLRYHYSISEVGVTGILVVGGRIVAARLDGSIDFLEMETFHNPVKTQVPLSPQSPRKQKKSGHTRYHSLGSDTGEIRVWDEVIQCSDVTTCRAHRQPINCIQCQGGRIVTASQDHTLKVFRLDNCLCLYTLHGHEGSVTSLCLDKVAPYAAVSGSLDGSVRIWDLLSGTCVHKFSWHDGSVLSILSSPLYIVSIGIDEKMCIWDRTKAVLLYTIRLDQGGVGSAALMSMNYIVTGGQGGLCLWDIPKGCLLRKVNFTDSDQQAFINHIVSIGNYGIVCDYGTKLKVVYFPTILEKAE